MQLHRMRAGRTTWGIILLMLVGCTTIKASPFPSHTLLPDPVVLYEKILSRCNRIQTLKALAEIQLKRGGKTLRFDEIVVFDRPASLRLETIDFWGHSIFVWIVHDKKWSTFSLEDTGFAQDQSAVDKIKEFIGFAWDPDVMAKLLGGNPFYLGIQEPVAHISRDEGYLLLDVSDTRDLTRYLVWVGYGDLPARSLLVTAPAEGQYPNGIEVEFGHYKRLEEIDFPFASRISFPSMDSSLRIEYRSVTLNACLDEGTFRFQAPSQNVGQ